MNAPSNEEYAARAEYNRLEVQVECNSRTANILRYARDECLRVIEGGLDTKGDIRDRLDSINSLLPTIEQDEQAALAALKAYGHE